MPRSISRTPTTNVRPKSTIGRSSRSMVGIPGSRAKSQSSRSRKTDRFTQSTFSSFSDRLEDDANSLGMIGNSFHPKGVRRWDGNERTTTNWDFLRRDPELWYPDGDCLVHFYEQGQSRRGPSLRLFLAAVESSNCRPLLERACARPVPESPTSGILTTFDDCVPTIAPSSGKYELYIPAPSHLNREEAFKYHLTTRNFFAWMFEKPVASAHLGGALIALLERMNEYRPDQEENQDDMLAYLDLQGYTDFRECPDHTLAILQFAEQFQYRELWTDAFVHCAGMNDILAQSAEFESTSRTSKALITRAHLEMDLRLEHAGRALGNFLEDDLSASFLGLGQAARVHLDRFRSFLQSFYVGKYGYWPPNWAQRRGAALPKSTYRSMYFEFRNLYDYLVDPDSTCSIQDNKPADGGICVLQNINVFDRRHRYASLPHVLPRIPQTNSFGPAPRLNSFSKVFGSKQTKLDRRMACLSALSAATNADDMRVMECSLVREYFRFEREYTMKEEEKISSSDARKVRWILVYGILQTLISVTYAPKEVRDAESVSYHLCCQVAGTPPWNLSTRTQQQKQQPSQKAKTQSTRFPVVLEKELLLTAPILGDRHPANRPTTDYIKPTAPSLAPDSQLTPTPTIENVESPADSTPAITPDITNATNDYFALRPHPLSTRSRPAAKPSIRDPSLARTLTSGRKLSVQCPQPLKAGFAETLINTYDQDTTLNFDPPTESDMFYQLDEPTTPASRTSTSDSSAGDRSASPRTPGGSGNEDGLPVMDHVSVCGSASSFYGEAEDGGYECDVEDEFVFGGGEITRRRQREMGMGMGKEKNPNREVWVRKRVSVESFGTGLWNPEVQSYVEG